MGGRDDLVPGLNPTRLEREPKRRRPRGNPHRPLGTHVLSKLSLKFVHLVAENELAVVQDPLHSVVDLVTDV